MTLLELLPDSETPRRGRVRKDGGRIFVCVILNFWGTVDLFGRSSQQTCTTSSVVDVKDRNLSEKCQMNG